MDEQKRELICNVQLRALIGVFLLWETRMLLNESTQKDDACKNAVRM